MHGAVINSKSTTSTEPDPTTEKTISYLDENSSRAQQLTYGIARMMTRDLQPYSLVDDDGFLTLMKIAEPRYKIPSRTTFSQTIIPKMYEDLKVHVKNEISTAIRSNSVFAFTTDGWTSRAVQSYMSLTVHYITPEFVLKHNILNLEHVPEKHTHKYIQSTIFNSLQTWSIDIEKPAFFTTDNGRNIAKAINTYEKWTRIPCFGHCLQLVIKSAMKNYKEYEELRKRCRSIVTFFAKSTTAREKFMNVQKTLDDKQTPLKLIQEVDTRWNSTYAMFKRFIVLQKSLNVILCEEYMPDNLTIEEWNFMEALIMILEPLKEATENMSGDSYPTISHYFPMYFALMNILQEESAENALITNISNSVQNALKTLGNTEEGPETFTTRKNREIQTCFAENLVPRKTNIIDWWKSNQTRFPILSRAAKDCLAVPATQVKSERLFSTAGNIVMQTRARLLPVNVQGLCFLHENLK
ncbi:E3 SUMO-protein ligase ZBED1-like [Colletes gigas]|uniref:E3 SUMO-protein ligase ZBED1-like n=1 Tax=Colletes gigas TaxID=935657 RepID=UPI001C9B3200|nr:E3 SUMO-protein ligase ZBED1-like [Colletes gigas]